MSDELQSEYPYPLDVMESPPGENDLSSYEGFEARKLYQVVPYFLNLPAPLRTWYESAYYGKVDRVQDGIILKKDTSILKQIKGQESANVLAVNFVADAFKDLRLHLQRAGDAGLIRTDTFYYKILAESSMVQYEIDRRKHLDFTANRLNSRINLSPTIYNKVVGFQTYVEELLNFYKTKKIEGPLTLTGYVVSRYSDVQMSGLYISLAREDYSIDRPKAEKYIFDPGFRCFVVTARKYGFYVDRNAPWRIVANPFSAPMMRYLAQYHYPSLSPMTPAMLAGAEPGVGVNQFFPAYYKKTYQMDLSDLKEQLLKMYNKYAEKNPRIRIRSEGTVGCPAGSVITTRIREQATMKDVEELGDIYWLKLYFMLRTREAALTFDDHDKKLRKAIEIYSTVGITKAIRYINDLIKPYLYEKHLGLVLTKPDGPVRIGEVGEQTYVTSNKVAGY